MCHLIHVADLPQSVVEAVVAKIHNDDRLSFGADDVGLHIDEWPHNECETFLSISESPATVIRQAEEVDTRWHDNSPTMVA